MTTGKNYDLKWAREWAGLTQAQAAEKIGVHRDTFSRWETGAQAIPVRKWQWFLKHVAVNPQDIPKRPAERQYNVDGFPVEFIRKHYGEGYKHNGDEDSAAEEEALTKFEGEEFPVRERERERLLMTKGMPAEAASAYMAEYDEEQRRLASGAQHRLHEQIHPGDYRTEEAKALENKRMLDWKRDPEEMAARVYAYQSKLQLAKKASSVKVEEFIRDSTARASNWISQSPNAFVCANLV